MNGKCYIAIKNEDDLLNKLFDLGYEWYLNISHDIIVDECKDNSHIFISIMDDDLGELVNGGFNEIDDMEMNVGDVPERKDLEEWIEWLKEGSKLGLL